MTKLEIAFWSQGSAIATCVSGSEIDLNLSTFEEMNIYT
jgi:hypothetical protein